MNDKFVQITGPFSANEDIIADIKIAYDDSFNYIADCGIQCEKTHIVNINGHDFEMGKTNILQYNEARITSLYFAQDEPATTVVDCIIEI